MLRLAVLLALTAFPSLAATKVIVTVIEQKSGAPVKDLKAGDFTVLDDKTPRAVESAEFSDGLIDVIRADILDSPLQGVKPVGRGSPLPVG